MNIIKRYTRCFGLGFAIVVAFGTLVATARFLFYQHPIIFIALFLAVFCTALGYAILET